MSALRLPGATRMALLAVLAPALLVAMLAGAPSASAAGSWWHLTSATALPWRQLDEPAFG